MRSGKLVIARPGTLPLILRNASDASRGRSALESLWADGRSVAALRARWQALFPGASLAGRSDMELRQQLEARIAGRQLEALFLRNPPPIRLEPRGADRARIMHLDVRGKTVLLGQKGAIPGNLRGSGGDVTEVRRLLQSMPPNHPAMTAIARQAPRLLPAGNAAGPVSGLGRQLAGQLATGRIDAAVLHQQHLALQAAKLPSAPRPVTSWTTKQKVYEAIDRAYALCGKDLRGALDQLRQPQNLAMMVGFLLVFAGLQLIPGVDIAVDFAMLVWLLYTVGTRSVAGARELARAVPAAAQAKSSADLDKAARHFADAFEALGEAGISALLAFLQGLRFASRFAKAGEAEGKAAAAGTKAGGGKPGGSAPAEPPLPAAVARMPKAFQDEYKAAEAAGWKKPDGSVWYPPNNGGVGPPLRTTLDEGKLLDRFGSDRGSFTSAAGDTFESRALPGTPGPLSQYRVTPRGAERMLVEKSEIAPWFNQPGGGTQYRLINRDGTPMSLADAVQRGLLEKVP